MVTVRLRWRFGVDFYSGDFNRGIASPAAVVLLRWDLPFRPLLDRTYRLSENPEYHSHFILQLILTSIVMPWRPSLALPDVFPFVDSPCLQTLQTHLLLLLLLLQVRDGLWSSRSLMVGCLPNQNSLITTSIHWLGFLDGKKSLFLPIFHSLLCHRESLFIPWVFYVTSCCMKLWIVL